MIKFHYVLRTFAKITYAVHSGIKMWWCWVFIKTGGTVEPFQLQSMEAVSPTVLTFLQET
ncbi:hypothetical protein T08_9453 [Trichinella sp. T8]|nr:hypothetical protein T08_9453 [Trichinella sp. T8]